jgi:carbon storage regulator
MLVLRRKANQAIVIGRDIRILVVGIDRDYVKLGIEAPRDVQVHRSEVLEEILRSNGAQPGLAEAACRSRAGESSTNGGEKRRLKSTSSERTSS